MVKKLFVGLIVLLIAAVSYADLQSDTDDNGAIEIVYGGTNATTAATARVNLFSGCVTTVNAATYNLLTTDYILSVTYTPTAATAITIPTAQITAGRIIIVKDAGGKAGDNNITIATEGSQTIDGSDTFVISSDYEAIMLYSDGSNLFVY